MAEQYGYAGKILKVDLTNNQITSIPSSNYLPKYFGGRGLANRLYWDEIPPEVGALDPENALIFTTGPLTATGAAMRAPSFCAGKSPQYYPKSTFYIGNSMGMWAHGMKYAGYDAFIIKGQADRPVYLWIDNDKIEIRDAGFLWGRTTRQTRFMMMDLYGDRVQVACIGPAGENLVIPSTINTDCNHAFAQGGMGAVMGSKKLKAIVVRGTGSIKVANPGKIIEINEAMRRLTSIKQGETRVVNGEEIVGSRDPKSATTAGYSAGTETNTNEKLGKIRLRGAGCPGCLSHCTIRQKYVDGSLPTGSASCMDNSGWIRPELMTGHYMGKTNWEWSMNNDELGLENFYTGTLTQAPISNLSPATSSLIFDVYYDAYKRGILTEDNTKLPWSKYGSQEFIQKLQFMIAYRQGFGDILANGLAEATKYIVAHEEFGPNREDMIFLYQKSCPKDGVFGGLYRHALVKGYGPGSSMSLASFYSAVDSKTGREIHGEVYRLPKELLTYFYGSDEVGGMDYWGDDLAQAVVKHQYYAQWADCAPMCAFQTYTHAFQNLNLADPSDYMKYSNWGTAEYLSAVFGEETTSEELHFRDEMLLNLTRAVQIRDGLLDGPVDTFFDCIYEEVDSDGKNVIPRDKFESTLVKYYQIMGWENGVPTRAKLEELDLKDIADDLDARGLLPA
jgi:aldehyde:ferredoxin oxidoreductase